MFFFFLFFFLIIHFTKLLYEPINFEMYFCGFNFNFKYRVAVTIAQVVEFVCLDISYQIEKKSIFMLLQICGFPKSKTTGFQLAQQLVTNIAMILMITRAEANFQKYMICRAVVEIFFLCLHIGKKNPDMIIRLEILYKYRQLLRSTIIQ